MAPPTRGKRIGAFTLRSAPKHPLSLLTNRALQKASAMQSRKFFSKSDHRGGRRRLALPLGIAVLFSCQLAEGADLSRYRQFKFGMSSAEVSQLIGVETSKV